MHTRLPRDSERQAPAAPESSHSTEPGSSTDSNSTSLNLFEYSFSVVLAATCVGFPDNMLARMKDVSNLYVTIRISDRLSYNQTSNIHSSIHSSITQKNVPNANDPVIDCEAQTTTKHELQEGE